MASSANSAVSYTLPYPSLALLPESLRNDEQLRWIYDNVIGSIEKNKVLDVQLWKQSHPKGDFKAWNSDSKNISQLITNKITHLREQFESASQRDGLDCKAFIAMWKRIEDMATFEVKFSDLQWRLDFHGSDMNMNQGNERGSAVNFADSFDFRIEEIEKLFMPYFDGFLSEIVTNKADIAKATKELKPLITDLVFEISAKTKDLRSALEAQAQVTTSTRLQEIINTELKNIKSLADPSDSVVNEEKPRLPLTSLIGDCAWHRAMWQGLLSICKTLELSKESNTLNESYKSIEFKGTGLETKASVSDRRKGRKKNSSSTSATQASGAQKRKGQGDEQERDVNKKAKADK